MSSPQYLSLETIENIKKIIFNKNNITEYIKNNNFYNLGIYYQFINIDYNLMKKYYDLAIENKQNISDIYNNFGFYYIDIEKKYDLGIEYYLKSINLNNVHAMNNVGLYYYNVEKNYFEAKKYFLMAIDKNLPEAYNNMGLYYYEIDNNIEIAILYFIEALCQNPENPESIKNNLKNITSPLERYILYKQNSIEITLDDDKEFNNDDSVVIFKNRLNNFSKFIECCICLTEYTNIPLECSHYICVDCYPKILQSQKCPLCRVVINS
jgi:tetratricopeptide (TPR) repeat protein